MLKVGLDGSTQNGSNFDLNDPIRRAVRYLGLSVDDAITVTDTDLSPIVGMDIEKLLDLSELRLLESIWGSWTEVSESVSLRKVEAQQLADRIQMRINDLVERLRKPYGLNTGAAAVGTIKHGRHAPADVRTTPRNLGFPITASTEWETFW